MKLKNSRTALENRVNATFEKWANEQAKKREGLHASTILAEDTGDRKYCEREIVYNLSGAPKEHVAIDLYTLRVFKNGWLLHEKYQQLFAEFLIEPAETTHYFDIDLQETTKELSLFCCTPDAIVQFEGDVKRIMEIKGYGTETFKNEIIEKLKESKQFKSAYAQCNFYMHLLGIHHGGILIEDKNTQFFMAIPVIYQESMMMPFLDRLNSIKAALKRYEQSAILPERVCKKVENIRACNCPFRKKCFDD